MKKIKWLLSHFYSYRARSTKERFVFWLYNVVEIFNSLIVVLTLGFFGMNNPLFGMWARSIVGGIKNKDE